MFSECQVMSYCLIMLGIFTTSKEVFGLSCIYANDILFVHYFEAVSPPPVVLSYTFRLCFPFNNNKMHAFFFPINTLLEGVHVKISLRVCLKCFHKIFLQEEQ